MPTPLPNQGRYSNLGPPNLDWIYPDPDSPLPISLLVVPPPQPRLITTPATSSFHTSKDNHWALYWPVHPPTAWSQSRRIIRRIHVQHDPGRDHLTFWGPLTVIEEESAEEVERSTRMRRFEMGEVGKMERVLLEEIAREVDVMEPDGEWNCQDWVREVLRRAVEKGVLEGVVCERVLREAEGVMPAKEGDKGIVDPSYTSVFSVG
ncbi:uncharacterized protein STEHIDRAFT_161997 [Stereum hirsutum FP-91666 SS1]|uniref:uncharacterized protein n=1 Tax=Stereum hirsutum (strain FP-91666) TaxID=721885 RepID=UPI00044499A6|nr:uncharacterized protein STEHIDRAFT_161997 [Stereum hirsutum FP-91666 SS1]EIM80990.1 hypothetical protein STEHIDRAFT_161997 [Stereum hirsutum FP-91666 SS1]